LDVFFFLDGGWIDWLVTCEGTATE
jgi:hypothetical protein